MLEDGYLDFTFERQLELTARDSREEGLERGRREGQIKAIARICKKGLSIQETTEMLEEDEALVREIYELADKYPDYDAGKLYERYEEERVIMG